MVFQAVVFRISIKKRVSGRMEEIDGIWKRMGFDLNLKGVGDSPFEVYATICLFMLAVSKADEKHTYFGWATYSSPWFKLT
jgi:hypothetical protein